MARSKVKPLPYSSEAMWKTLGPFSACSSRPVLGLQLPASSRPAAPGQLSACSSRPALGLQLPASSRPILSTGSLPALGLHLSGRSAERFRQEMDSPGNGTETLACGAAGRPHHLIGSPLDVDLGPGPESGDRTGPQRVDALRVRLEEKEQVLSKKSKQLQDLSDEKSTLAGEIRDMKDMLDVKERKVAVLQKKTMPSQHCVKMSQASGP
ncbi:hypothetical protein CRUP_003081 [Coryphaenoides rupestris]|nr:hypothetical protein CRUP_003081 [Coryphaenoides rupestris]